ncbi:MAG: hypothetical protein ACRDG7_01260 [Candidatus Limnocylindria bacterium]
MVPTTSFTPPSALEDAETGGVHGVSEALARAPGVALGLETETDRGAESPDAVLQAASQSAAEAAIRGARRHPTRG